MFSASWITLLKSRTTLEGAVSLIVISKWIILFESFSVWISIPSDCSLYSTLQVSSGISPADPSGTSTGHCRGQCQQHTQCQERWQHSLFHLIISSLSFIKSVGHFDPQLSKVLWCQKVYLSTPFKEKKKTVNFYRFVSKERKSALIFQLFYCKMQKDSQLSKGISFDSWLLIISDIVYQRKNDLVLHEKGEQVTHIFYFPRCFWYRS